MDWLKTLAKIAKLYAGAKTCLARGHLYADWPNYAGVRNVKFCPRCERCNPMSEWRYS